MDDLSNATQYDYVQKNVFSEPTSCDIITICICSDISFFLHFEAIAFYEKLVNTKRAIDSRVC